MTRRALAEAVVTRLAGAGVTVHEAKVPNNPSLPYAVLYVGGGVGSVGGLDSVSDRSDMEFQITAVGLSGASVRIVADACYERVVDWSPVVAGWECFPVRHVAAQSLRRDDDVDPPQLWGVDVFRLSAVAAA